MLNIKEQLEEIYNYYKETYREMSKLEFVASETFGLTTYDSSLDELFATKIIEVLQVIIERKNFLDILLIATFFNVKPDKFKKNI